MKQSRQLSFLLAFALLISGKTFGINYVSNASADWSVSTTWLPVGVPGFSDNVTISSGHTVTVNTDGDKCNNLTVNGTISWLSARTLTIRGNYSISATGAESGTSGRVQFDPGGTSITVASGGVTASGVGYQFYASRTITAGSSVNKSNSVTRINSSVTVTNLGTYRTGTMDDRTGSAFVNGAGAILFIKNNGFMSGHTFTCSAANNTVQLNYIGGAVPVCVGGVFHHLVIGGNGTKTMPQHLVLGGNLTINTSNTLNSSNRNITLAGNWNKQGAFTATAGRTVTFNGTSLQTIAGTGTTTFEQLTINNTAGVNITSGAYLLNQVLTISNGTFNTNGNSFTMVSNATQTARIAPITGTGAISGNFTIQRFLSARTQSPTDDPGHWSDLSSSVQNSTVSDWDNELFFNYTHNPPAMYSNIVVFDETADDYVGVSASTTMLPGLGFEIALTDDGTLTSFSNTTLTTTGVPNHLDQDLSPFISFNGSGSNLVGNPFASSISWSSVFAASSGILNTYDEYDANAADYVTFGLGTEIGAGQGFWVYTTGPAHSLVVPETAKTTSTNSTILAPIARKHMVLKIRGAHEPESHSHKLLVAASPDASDGWDLSDHPYKKSPARSVPSITSKVDNKELKINTFSSLNETYTMPLSTRGRVSGNYTIEIESRDIMEEYSCIYLEDTQTNKWMDLNNVTSYSFNMTANDSEARFVLHFSKNGDCKAPQLPVVNELNNQLNVLPTAEGNDIVFNMNDATDVRIDVTNVLGQQLMNSKSITATNQTEKIFLPSDFSGMYLIRISSDKETIVKKFVRK